MIEADIPRLCPGCNGAVHSIGKDDIGTERFKCEKCGKITSKPLSPKQKAEGSRREGGRKLEENWGYKFQETEDGIFVLLNNDDGFLPRPCNPIFTFRLKDLTSQRLKKTLQEKMNQEVPLNVIEEELSRLALEHAELKEQKKQKDNGFTLVTPEEGEEEPVKLEHLTMIENPDVAGKLVLVDGVVASTSLAYLVPSELDVMVTDKYGNDYQETLSVGERSQVNIKLVGVNEDVKNRRLRQFVEETIEKKGRVTLQVNKVRTIYKVRVRPPVFTLEKRQNRLVDQEGFEYKALEIYISSPSQLHLPPSSLVTLEGTVAANPKTQNVTILVHKVEFPEENRYFNTENLSKLQARFKVLSIAKRLEWILENFEAYSQIHGRHNVATAALLDFFSSLHVRFNGEDQRGWSNTAIIGDTTTGKTETMRKLIMLLRAGVLISAETASTVGLVGTATQTEKGEWFIDWGFLPLNDRKLLAIDGAHKLPRSQWAALAESERSGVVTIAKAAKDTAYARTRQIKIANPVDRETDDFSTQSLASFLYPVQALGSIYDKTSIARLDMAVFTDRRDIKPEEVNLSMDRTYDQDLEILADALRWCWSNTAKVNFTPEAVKELLMSATNLYKTFFCDSIPLVSIDMKWKLARLSAGLAYLTLSTDDFKTVTVTEEHVRTIVHFIKDEYSKAGLNTLAQESKFEILTEEELRLIIFKLGQAAKIDELLVSDIIRFIATQGRVTRDQVKEKFDLTENKQLRPLLATLQSEKLLRSGKGLYPMPKMIEAYKILTRLPSLTSSKIDPPQTKLENAENREEGGSSPSLVRHVSLDRPILSTIPTEGSELRTVEKDTRTPQQLGTLSNSVDSQKQPASLPTVEPQEDERVCGKCAVWHKPGCSYPDADPSCVNPLNRYAIDCKDFILKEAP